MCIPLIKEMADINTVITFKEIPEHGFFIYNGTKLCKFGLYGVGVDSSGPIFHKLSDHSPVIPTTL